MITLSGVKSTEMVDVMNKAHRGNSEAGGELPMKALEIFIWCSDMTFQPRHIIVLKQ